MSGYVSVRVKAKIIKHPLFGLSLKKTYLDNLLMAVFLINTALIKNANTYASVCECGLMASAYMAVHKCKSSSPSSSVDISSRSDKLGKKEIDSNASH